MLVGILLAVIITGCIGGGQSASAPSAEEVKETPAPASPPPTTTPPSTEAPPPSKTLTTPVEVVSSNVDFPGGGLTISGYLSRPKVEGRLPAVLILHGTEGFQNHHKEYARELAENGYVALAMCWFGCSGGRNSLSEIELGDISSTVEYLKSLEYVDKNRIGVIGFSRGASLALLSASRIRDFKAVVDYYGPARISSAFSKILQTSPTGSEYGIENINGPVLILHGTDDQTVKVRAAYILEDLMKKHGKIYEIKIYPGVGHAFNWVDGKGLYNAAAAEDAWNRTVAFLDKYLWEAG
jgi:carboxymethylenebutenolidase